MPSGRKDVAADQPRKKREIRLANRTPLLARLAANLGARGHDVAHDSGATNGARTWMLGSDDAPDTAGRIAAEGAARGDRIVVVGWIGVHPDARASALRRLWDLEERCRASAVPTLALRLGPLVGPDAPLLRRLAGTPPKRSLACKLAHPVLESDVAETLHRAMTDEVAWEGWYELGGPDVLSFAELAALAGTLRPRPGETWEPDPETLAEQRLIEPEIWARWIGFSPASVVAEIARWAA